MASPKSPDQVLTDREYADQLVEQKRQEHKANAIMLASGATVLMGQLLHEVLQGYGGITGYAQKMLATRALAIELGKPGVAANIDRTVPQLLAHAAKLGGSGVGEYSIEELEQTERYLREKAAQEQRLQNLSQTAKEVEHATT